MSNQDLKERYFNWMTVLVMPQDRIRRKYSMLLNALDESIFHFTIPLDENRLIDGMDLRYRFGHQNNIPEEVIREQLDITSVSMLEMMVALALRGEEHIMDDPSMGNQMSTWFWEMINSLKLNSMSNDNFDQRWVAFRIDILLNHSYEYNGEGGLFTIPNPRQDLRTVEIWYQMCWYLDAILKDKIEGE